MERIPTGYDGIEALDPDAPAVAPQRSTALDRLRTRLQKEATRPPLDLKVPTREGLAVRFDVNGIESERLEAWQRASKKRVGGKETYDLTRMGALVIASTAKAILVDGEVVEDENGNPIRLTSPMVRDMLSIADGEQAPAIVRALYASDGHVVTTSQRILAAAGWGDEPEDLDEETPTNES